MGACGDHDAAGVQGQAGGIQPYAIDQTGQAGDRSLAMQHVQGAVNREDRLVRRFDKPVGPGAGASARTGTRPPAVRSAGRTRRARSRLGGPQSVGW